MTDKPLAELGKAFHKTAKEKGWWEGNRNFGELLALIHSEVSEALEEWRTGIGFSQVYAKGLRKYPMDGHVATDEEFNPLKPEGIPIELADIIIRVLEVCYAYNIDIDTAVKIKAEYNKTRPYRHGRKLA